MSYISHTVKQSRDRLEKVRKLFQVSRQLHHITLQVILSARRFLVMKILSVNPVSYIQIRCRLSERARIILQFTVANTMQLKAQGTGGAARN